MNPQDPNVVRVELVAEALGDLCHELVFVGGCAVSMLIDAPTAPPARVTYDAAASAVLVALPSGRRISLIASSAFLATKFEAFHSRGKSDVVMSHDLEDIINVIEGRQAIVDEVAAANPALRAYLAARFRELVQHPDFDNALPGLIAYDELYQSRIAVVRNRISAITGLETS